jgi:hypothetical protein
MPDMGRGRTRKRASTLKAEIPPPIEPGLFVSTVNSLLEKVGLGPMPSVTGQMAFIFAWSVVILVFLFFTWQWRGVRSDIRALDARLQHSTESWDVASKHVVMREELDGVMQAMHDLQRRSEALVRMELMSTAPSTLGKGKPNKETNGALTLEQLLDGDAGNKVVGGKLLDGVREQQPLLAERVLTLQQMNDVVRQLEDILASGGDSVEGELKLK